MKRQLIVMVSMVVLACIACTGSVTGDDDGREDVDTTAVDSGASERDGPAESDSASTEASMSAEDPTSSTTESSSTIVTNPPKEAEPTPSTTSPSDQSRGIDPALAPFVDLARTDLADRLGIVPDAITVVSAELVVWPDTSVGCPQPGMAYAQVPTDGSLIVLAFDGVEYRYHTGGSASTPFLCE